MKKKQCLPFLLAALIFITPFLFASDVNELTKLLNSGKPEERVKAAEDLGKERSPEATAELTKRLIKEREAGVQVAIIDALKAAGANSPEAVDALCKVLESKVWQVTAGAAELLKTIGDKKAIDPLNNAMSAAQDNIRLRAIIEDAIIVLSGGGGNVPDGGKQGETGVTFYGLPVKTSNYIFVIDISGSMLQKATWKPDPKEIETGIGKKDGDDKPLGDRKIDVAKFELIKVLKKTPDGGYFNIVAFNSEVSIFERRMVKMTESSRRRAIKFVGDLQATERTNLYDATELAFTFTGVKPSDSEGIIATGGGTTILQNSADTIFLLSDGMPNLGKITDSSKIRKAIGEMNKLRKLVINVIGIFSPNEPEEARGANPGKKAARAFLKGIASDNDGAFTERN